MGACFGRSPHRKPRRRSLRKTEEPMRPSELQLKVMGEMLHDQRSESIRNFDELTTRSKKRVLELYNASSSNTPMYDGTSPEGNVSMEEIEELQEDYGIEQPQLGSYFDQIRSKELLVFNASSNSIGSDLDIEQDFNMDALSVEPLSPFSDASRYSLREELFPEIFGAFEKFSEEVLEGQYELIMELGAGAHGAVYMAKTTKKHLTKPADKLVAIKQMDNIFEKAYKAKCVVREMRAERYFGGHGCITELIDVFIPKPHNLLKFQSVLLVFEYCECALDEHIENPDVEWTEKSIQDCIKQLLMGVKYLHTGKFVHRDLKPENILLNPSQAGKYDYKLADFGLSRCFGKNEKQPEIESAGFFVPPQDPTVIKFTPQLTKRVVTRYYRAPEVSLLMQNRSQLPKIDIWSLGCILAELIQLIPGNEGRADMTGSEILLRGAKDLVLSPNKNIKSISKDQLVIIFNFLGSPSDAFIDQISNQHIRKWVMDRPKTKPQNLKKLFPVASKECLNLLQGMLKYDPKERLSAEECLTHPWLTMAVDNAVDLTHEPIIEDYEDVYLNDYELRLMVVDEILYYHPEWTEHLQYRRLATNASQTEFTL